MSHEPITLQRASRKDKHLELAMRLHGQDRVGAFDDVSFIHYSLPGVSAEQVDIDTTASGCRWGLPFYINTMTGGTQATAVIDVDLAEVTAEAGVAIVCGSQHVTLRDPERAGGFHVIRHRVPGTFALINVGPTVGPQEALQAVEMLEVNALQIHLNAAQELVMPEGDCNFTGWSEMTAGIITAMPVLVVVKEVDFGLSRRTIEALARTGVAAVDVAGAGGTDFIAIENERQPQRGLSYLVSWGQPTALCLLESLSGSEPASLPVLTSGGVRNPLDVVRSLALGACVVGASGHVLRTLVKEGPEALCQELHTWSERVHTLIALLGAADVSQLRRTDVLVTGSTAEWARLLGVDLAGLAHRSDS